jgi:hypothetical protein
MCVFLAIQRDSLFFTLKHLKERSTLLKLIKNKTCFFLFVFLQADQRQQNSKIEKSRWPHIDSHFAIYYFSRIRGGGKVLFDFNGDRRNNNLQQ